MVGEKERKREDLKRESTHTYKNDSHDFLLFQKETDGVDEIAIS